MNKCLLLPLIALSGSMIAQDAQNGDQTKDLINPNPDTLQVIQKFSGNESCVRFIGTGLSHNNHKQTAIKDLPVTDATKEAICKLWKKSLDAMVSCSDCTTDSYHRLVRYIYWATDTHAPKSSKVEPNIINEVPVQVIRDDLDKYDRSTYFPCYCMEDQLQRQKVPQETR